jgi:hypothetical protein
MACNRVDYPTTPNPVSGDWAKIINLVAKAFLSLNDPLQVDGSNIPLGATFQVEGVVYHTDSDTAITGTPSDYVKLIPNSGDSGATADFAFVANLSGVTWNKIYNGYYDSSDNLYIFDETKAILVGDLSIANSRYSYITDNPTFNTIQLADLTSDPGSPVAGQIWFRSNA